MFATKCLVSIMLRSTRYRVRDGATFLLVHPVASKCGVRCFNGESGVTNSASHINKYIDGTIERLGFTPDLYYLHRIDPNTPLEESIPALDGLRKVGKTKYIGLSECSAKTLRKANDSKLNFHSFLPMESLWHQQMAHWIFHTAQCLKSRAMIPRRPLGWAINLGDCPRCDIS